MTKFVTFFRHSKGKYMAEHLNRDSGKPYYFDATLVAKEVAVCTRNIYKVKIENGRVTKILFTVNRLSWKKINKAVKRQVKRFKKLFED